MEERIRIIPLGGVDEIGKNITVIEYGDDIIVVDCGSIFPKEDMLGIDLVIPDVTYLIRNKERIRGFVITHGHEDHIGAIPYVMQQVQAPIYGTRLTIALIENKLREKRVTGVPMQVVKPKDTVRLGAFSVQFIKVSHSIAGACALAITCAAGTVIVSGDFKIDYTPIDGEVTDLNTLASWGSKGVLAFLCESTNVERAGYTMSEKKIGERFQDIFRDAKGRLIIATFASNIHRLQQVVDSCVAFNRKICFIGRSMINVTRLAIQLGDLIIPPNCQIDIDDMDLFPNEQIVVLTTGSQGEPMSGLTRMAYSEHRKLKIRSTDTVVISATPIPGNEVFISRVINQLYRCGAHVIYKGIAEVHVSGHACQEELKLMHTLVKAKVFIPVHGEYRMLHHHAKLAESLGMSQDNIIIPEIGQIIEVSNDSVRIAGSVPTGGVMIDGLGIGDVGNVVLRDRKHLSQDGLIIVAVGINMQTGRVSAGPELISRGFVYVRENEDLMENSRAVVRDVLSHYDRIENSDWTGIKNQIKDNLHRYIFTQIKRNPMILPIFLNT